jgi:hypothetical protein
MDADIIERHIPPHEYRGGTVIYAGSVKLPTVLSVEYEADISAEYVRFYENIR